MRWGGRWAGRRRDSARGDVHRDRAAELLERWRERTRATEQDRRRQFGIYAIVAVQAGVPAGLAWLVARHIGSSTNPVFAPIAAVGTVAAAVRQRLRRTTELIIGVALGIGVGDGIIYLVGRGTAQVGLIVTATILLAVGLTGRGSLITQAGGTAVLVATITPARQHVEAPQITNAIIGGLTALAVVIVLFPLNPLRTVERALRPELTALSMQLEAAGNALSRRDSAAVQQALDRLRTMGGELQRLSDAFQGASEVVKYSPQRRHWHNSLDRIRDGAEHLDRAVRSSRGLTRRAVTLIQDNEPIPATLPAAVIDLGLAVGEIHDDVVNGHEPQAGRERSLKAVSEAGHAGRDGLGLSGEVVMAQVRTIASDLLQATAVGGDDANRLVREAADAPHSRRST
jgi:uncharacterized membrane protein YgaE (UPF0421/DUF939 family)